MEPVRHSKLLVRQLRVAVIGGIATVGVVAILQGETSDREAKRCAEESWSSETSLLPSGLALTQTSVAAVPNGAFVAGLAVSSSGDTERSTGPLIVVDAYQRRFEHSGPGPFIAPRIVVGGDQRLHAVWVTRAASGTGQSDSITGLWHGSMDPSGQWSEPIRLMAGLDVRVAEFAVDGRGRIHLFAAVIPPAGPWYTAYLRFVGGEWLHADSLPFAVDVGASPVGPYAHVAYIANSQRFGPHTLFIAPLTGAGVGTPQAIAQSEESSRIAAVYVMGSEDHLDVVWTTRRATFDLDQLIHTRLRHGGWTRPDTLRILESALPRPSVVSRCGDIEVYLLVWEDGETRLRRYRWRNSWLPSPLPVPDSGLVFSHALADGGDRDEVVLVWNTIRTGDGASTEVQTLLSTLAPN